MDPGADDAPGLGESPNPSPSTTSSSLAVAVDTQVPTKDTADHPLPPAKQAAAAAAAASSSGQPQPRSRYESQKRRDWNSFLQYLKNHKPSSLALSRCSGAHVIEFLKYLDQFGKTKVHAQGCPYFGRPSPPAPCACPLRQAWGSLDALVGRLRAAYQENGAGSPGSNLFGAKAVMIYLREVRESQEKARGIPYQKKRRKRQTMMSSSNAKESPGSSSAAATAGTLKAAADDDDDDDESSKKLQLPVVRRPPTPRN